NVKDKANATDCLAAVRIRHSFWGMTTGCSGETRVVYAADCKGSTPFPILRRPPRYNRGWLRHALFYPSSDSSRRHCVVGCDSGVRLSETLPGAGRPPAGGSARSWDHDDTRSDLRRIHNLSCMPYRDLRPLVEDSHGERGHRSTPASGRCTSRF